MSSQALHPGHLAADASPDALRSELARLHEDRARLKGEVARLERHVSELSMEVATADEKVGDLQKLLLAAQRLDACADRAAVLSALQDIVVTVVGADDFVVLALDDEGSTLWPILGFGPGGSACGPLRATDDLVSTAVASVPLMAGSAMVGMLLIFTLLAHRPELRARDLELLDFLSAHATTALQITDLRADGVPRPLSLL